MLKERNRKILKILLLESRPVTISYLSKVIGVNPRTIRYDLKELEEWLVGRDIILNRKTRIGVWIEASEKEKKHFLGALQEEHPQKGFYHANERKKIILIELLLRNEPMKVKEFEILLQVSESTILRDLNELEVQLGKYKIRVIRKQNYGIFLEAREQALRSKVFELIMDDATLVDPILNHLKDSILDRQNQTDMKHSSRYQVINQIVQNVLIMNKIMLAEGAIIALTVHLIIAVYRIENGNKIDFPLNQLNYLMKQDQYGAAMSIVEKLSKELDLTIPDEEIGYITIHLLGAKVANLLPQKGNLDESTILLKGTIQRMIEIVGQFLAMPFESDRELVQGLEAHMRPMLERLKYNIPPYPAELLDIKGQYPSFYYATEAGVKVLEDVYQLNIPPQEIAYLSMHFGAAVERQKTDPFYRKFKVLLVCGTGLGSAQLLKQRLLQEFPHFQVLDTCSMLEIDAFVNQGIDLCITTIPFVHPRFECIKVNPLLTENDIQYINTKIYQEDRNSFEMLTKDIVDRAFQLGMVHPQFEKEIKKSLRSYKVFSKKTNFNQSIMNGRQKMLTELLTRDTIAIRESCNSWEDAVRTGGELLQRVNGTNEAYTEAIIAAIHKHGPYMVIAPGIVLLHARPEDGVLNVCMSLQIIKSGVVFGHKDRDPVSLVFAFGAIDTKSHLLALSQLMNLFNDETLLNQLRKCSSEKEAVSILHQLVSDKKEDIQC